MKHLNFWSKMTSLVVAVIALCLYQAHAFQWQEEMEENQKEIAEANAQIAAASGAAVTYLDGVYVGEGEGFGGMITVQVTVNDGKIAFIEITEASGEDTAYLDKAEQIIYNIVTEQTPEVDTISGATFSSNGIKAAVQNALADAVDTTASAAGTAAPQSYADGTYTGSGEGFGGTVSVEVTVTDSKIASVEITDASGEDAAYLDKAKQIIDDMIAAQTPEVDTISGATFSSNGIKTAVQQALEGAVES